jgi:hypothetical protein
MVATGAAAGTAKPEVTAIMARPIHDAQVVRGDDGKDHVEYDLLVVKCRRRPALSSVTVLDPAGRALGRIDGDTLAGATQTVAAWRPARPSPSTGAWSGETGSMKGTGARTSSTSPFGADVLAVADGTVVVTQDGEPEQSPAAPRPAEKQSDIGGNKVILRIAPKVFAAYTSPAPWTSQPQKATPLAITPVSRQVRSAYPLWGSRR